MFMLPAQPQPIGRTLDTGFRLYIAGFKKILPFALGDFVNWTLLGVTLIVFFMGEETLALVTAGEMSLPVFFGTIFATLLTGMCVSFIFMGAMLATFDAVARGEPLGIGAALKLGLRKLPANAMAAFIYVVAFLIGFMLLIVPGIFLSGALLLSMCAVVLENRGPVDASRRSMHLIRGNWWRAVIIFNVPLFVMMIITMALGMPLILMEVAAPDSLALSITSNVVQAALYTFTGPMVYSMLVALYHDLKLRREGGDLLARIEAEPAIAG